MANGGASRTRALLLMVVGGLTFVGTTHELLPAIAFFPAAAVCLLGVVSFVGANRRATNAEEKRLRQSLDPSIRSRSADRHATAQARLDGRALESLATRDVHRLAGGGSDPIELGDGEIVLTQLSGAPDAAAPEDGDGGDAELVVASDVSFPVELQRRESLADQLEKLNRLRESGVISAEELAIAKARLLG